MFDYKQRIISKEAGDNYDRIFKKGKHANKISREVVCEKSSNEKNKHKK